MEAQSTPLALSLSHGLRAKWGATPGADLGPFIPWEMSDERQQQLAKPMPMTGADPPVADQSSLAQPP
ncbi:MAG: hypothetical protein ABFS45_14615 [Pseudomonadota bacterium]